MSRASYLISRFEIWYCCFIIIISLASAVFTLSYPFPPYITEKKLKDSLYIKVAINGNVFYRDEQVRILIYFANKGNDTAEIIFHERPWIYITIHNEKGEIEKKFVKSFRYIFIYFPCVLKVRENSEELVARVTFEINNDISAGRHLLNVTVFIPIEYSCTFLIHIVIKNEPYYPIYAIVDALLIFTPAILIFMTFYVLPKILISKIIKAYS